MPLEGLQLGQEASYQRAPARAGPGGNHVTLAPKHPGTPETTSQDPWHTP